MKKYLFNKYGFLFFTALVFIILSLSIPYFSGKFAPVIEHSVENSLRIYFGKDTVIKGVSYHFPNSIIIKGLVIDNWDILPSGCRLSAEKVMVKFSLAGFLYSRNISFSKISFYHPVLIFKGYRFDFARAGSRNLKLAPMMILVKQGELIFGDNQEINLGVDGIFKYHPVRGIAGQGDVYLEKIFAGNRRSRGIEEFFKDKPLIYEFTGYFNNAGFAIERVQLKLGKIYSKFWGALDDNVLRLNGFILLSQLFNAGEPGNDHDSGAFSKDNRFFTPLEVPAKGPVDALGGLLLNKFAPVVSSNFDVYDFESLVKLDLPSIDIQQFSGTLGGVPFNLDGRFSFGRDLLMDMRLSTFGRQARELRLANPKAFDLAVSGDWSTGVFNGKILCKYLSFGRRGLIAQKIYSQFKDLDLVLGSGQNVKASFDKGIFYCLLGGKRCGLQVQDFNAIAQLKKTNLEVSSLNSRFYDGRFNGKGNVDFGFLPFHNDFELHLEKVDLKRAAPLFKNFSGIQGTIDADVIYNSYPWEKSRGSFTIKDGSISGFGFLKWLGRSFEIKDLNSLDFKTASSYFYFDSDDIEFKKFLVDSDKVKLRGNFNFKGGLISSKVSAVFSRQFLKDSKKLRPLVAILGKNMPLIDFDFQLSGAPDAVNFKWLNSDFKERLYSKIPGFVRGSVEKDIENVLKPLLAQ